MAVLEVSVLPLGTQSASISSYIQEVIEEIERQGLNYSVTPTGTVIEGDTDTLMEISKRLHKKTLERSNRVVTNIQIDERTDKNLTMDHLVEAAKLGAGVGADSGEKIDRHWEYKHPH